MQRRFAFPRFAADRRGATAVEFAIVAPVLFLFLCGIIEAGVCFTADVILQNAANTAARTGRTGYIDDAATRDQTVKSIVEAHSQVILDYTKLKFSSKSYDNLNGVGNPEPFVDANSNGLRDDGESYTDVNGNGRWDKDRGRDGYGGANQIVVYTITYPWTFFTPIVGNAMSDDGTLLLTATAIIQNEPY